MRTNAHTDEVNCSHAAMVSHAGLVAYLAGPEAGFVTGASLTIDGGFAA